MAASDRHLVVDGSNIATEGRSLPSLDQLIEAVRAIDAEYNYESLTVIVDATFAHRIDASERDRFEEAVTAGDIVAPPAGAIGRGDAFILQVASKAGASVFSNDSFQEFHGEHEWLFDEGRLIGGKPIEGVGWVFVERAPVRGPASRRSVREASDKAGRRRSRSSGGRSGGRSKASTAAAGPPPKPSADTPPPKARKKATKKATPAKRPTDSTTDSNAKKTKTTAKTTTTNADKTTATTAAKKKVEELNDARAFIGFISAHSLGDDVEATVERFSSHGCYLRVGQARCYLPSKAMGDPPPSRARDVVSQDQTVIVKVESLDSDRRGINVSLVRVVDDDPSAPSSEPGTGSTPGATQAHSRNPANSSQESDTVADGSGREGKSHKESKHRGNQETRQEDGSPRGLRPRRRQLAARRRRRRRPEARLPRRPRPPPPHQPGLAEPRQRRRPPRRQQPEGLQPKRRPPKRRQPPGAAAKKTTAKKTTAKKATAKKTAAKKTTARKTTAKKTAARGAAAKKTTAKKTAARGAAAKKTTAKKATAKKTAARGAAAKKTTAKKATAKKK